MLRAMEGGIQDFITGGEDIVVTDCTQYLARTWATVSRKPGEVMHQYRAGICESNPASTGGYIIPRAWFNLAECLCISRHKVEIISKLFVGKVEAYAAQCLHE